MKNSLIPSLTAQGSNWYALSGYQGDNILYVKSWVGRPNTNRLSLDYPTRLKTTYDGDVNYIVQHFRPGGFGGNALMSL